MSLNVNLKIQTTFCVILFSFLAISLCDVTSEVCIFGDHKDCAFPCRCSPGSQCDSWSGKCRLGKCKQDKSSKNGARVSWKWRGPGCQTGNIAFNKKAISNDFSAEMGDWVADNSMTDGITRSSTRNCPMIWTDSKKPTPTSAAWLIDLEKPHKINGFVLYVFSKNVGKVRATVGNTTSLSEHVTCSVLRNNRRLRKKLSVELNCSTPLIGRYVSVVKDPDLDDHIDSLELCEISVTGHVHYNIDWSTCVDSDFNEIWCTKCMNRLPPDCMMPCPKGKHGSNCELSCEPCSGPCNPKTGRCDDNSDGKGGSKDIPDNKPETNSTSDITTTAGTLIDQVVFVTQEERDGVIGDVTLGVEDEVTVDTNKVVHSVVQVQVGNSNQSKSSQIVTPYPVSISTKTKKKPLICDFGYFGKRCMDKCGSCSGGKTCDPDLGTCENGCEEWYTNGEKDCDTYIPEIHLEEENILIFPTPYSFKIKLYGIPKVDEAIEGLYKGEVRSKLLKDPENDEDDGEAVLTFYPQKGSFVKELSISGLKENTQYVLSFAIHRIQNGHTSPGNEIIIITNTSIVKPDIKPAAVPRKINMFSENSYTFFLLVAGFALLLVCVTGVILFFCIRSKKLKDGSSISTSDSRSDMSNNGGPVSLSKVEQDPIYQFIDDGGDDLKYHVYHDIDELAKNRYPLWNDSPKISKDDFTGSVHLISRPPYNKKQSYIPEIKELEELRRRENLSITDLSLINNGYLTTGAVKDILPERSWSFSQQPPQRVPSVPRYVRTSHGSNGGNRNRNSIPDRTSKPECDYLLPVQQQPPTNQHQIHNDSNTAAAFQQNHSEVIPDYMMPVLQQTQQRHTGYIPMDANTPSQPISPQRRGYFSCINNSPNNIFDGQYRRYPLASNDSIAEDNLHHNDRVRETHSPYIDMA